MTLKENQTERYNHLLQELQQIESALVSTKKALTEMEDQPKSVYEQFGRVFFLSETHSVIKDRKEKIKFLEKRKEELKKAGE